MPVVAVLVAVASTRMSERVRRVICCMRPPEPGVVLGRVRAVGRGERSVVDNGRAGAGLRGQVVRPQPTPESVRVRVPVEEAVGASTRPGWRGMVETVEGTIGAPGLSRELGERRPGRFPRPIVVQATRRRVRLVRERVEAQRPLRGMDKTVPTDSPAPEAVAVVRLLETMPVVTVVRAVMDLSCSSPTSRRV